MIRHGRMMLFGITLLTAAVTLTPLVACGQATGLMAPPVASGEPTKEGGWLVQRDEQTGIQVRTMEMTLHPKAEPRPALVYQFLPDEFEMLEGNAAIYYLKAMGFLEQDPARNRIREIHAEAAKRALSEDKLSGEVPPHSWLSMTPGELPLDEVKEFLRFTSFQPPFLKEAARRRRCDLDRNIREVENPIAYLIPEVQSMRELARSQSLRCKVAVAQGRVDDAIAIIGQQYAMARHLGQDEFLVTSLVGIACASIAWDDTLHLLQHPDTPNLYWAFASLPHPLVDVKRSMAYERQFLYLQFKLLREVDETPRSAGYWRDMLDRLLPHAIGLSGDFHAGDQKAGRATVAGYVAMSYPGAKRYLIEDCGLPAAQVEAYPTVQVVLLAVVRYYEEARDDVFKWSKLPVWQTERDAGFGKPARAKEMRVGWAAMPTQMLLPAIYAIRSAVARHEQTFALAQTVEAIRMYGAAHDGKLPRALDDLPVPAPLEPFTGKPLDYRYHDTHAVLTGHEMPGLQYRLVLRFAEKAE